MEKKFHLNKNWQFKLVKINYAEKGNSIPVNKGKWYKAKVPGTIHTDLLNLKLIEEPFYSDNEKKLQWVGESNWSYKAKFDYPEDFDKGKPVYLKFDGIDTVADVVLNGEKLGSVNNMFLKYKYEISDLVKTKNNMLQVNFTSPVKFAKELEIEKGRLPVSHNSERVYIRKAQYSFSWDWGPLLTTTGLWKDVYLTQPEEYFIDNFTFNTLRIEDGSATVKLKIKLNKPSSEDIDIKLSLSNNKNKIEFIEPAVKDSLEIIKEISIKNPFLWWPNGSGEQNLYNLEIQLLKNNKILDKKLKKVGIRTIELQLKDGDKNTFRFIVNNKPMFLKGADWIPADSFLPRIDGKKYKKLLSLAKEANMNAVRVWGGGIYENDIFYDLCDELGLLVWQDFMFACGSYPEYEEFISNVKAEVEQNVLRLQYHPSIAIWCGNNENEWGWYGEQGTSYKEMPGYKIYHEVIPEILNRLDTGIAYWPSSPFGNEDDPNSTLSGNRHQWNVWSGWMDYKNVKDDDSLFVTEFGFQSSANYSTMKKVLPKDQRNSQSRIFEFHNKQVEGPERLFKFLSAHFPVKTGLKDFIYLTQLNQGLALKECLEHWQFRYPETNGAIIWQLNDCWPVSSWSLIDSDLSPKLSYYLVKEVFSNYLISTKEENKKLKILIFNNTQDKFKGVFQINGIALPSGSTTKLISRKVSINPFSVFNSYSHSIDPEIQNGNTVYVISLRDEKDNLINRNFYAGAEFKYLKMPQPKIKIKFVEKNNAVKVSSDKPAFFVFLESSSMLLDKNGLILLPGEKVILKNYGSKKNFKKKQGISYTTLNQYLEN